MRQWELKIRTADGKLRREVWDGETGEEAARRYADAHRGASVIAFRPHPRHGVFHFGRGSRIIE